MDYTTELMTVLAVVTKSRIKNRGCRERWAHMHVEATRVTVEPFVKERKSNPSTKVRRVSEACRFFSFRISSKKDQFHPNFVSLVFLRVLGIGKGGGSSTSSPRLICCWGLICCWEGDADRGIRNETYISTRYQQLYHSRYFV